MDPKVTSSPQNKEELQQYIKDRMQGERLDIEAIRNRLVSVAIHGNIGCQKLKPYPSYRQLLEDWEPRHAAILIKESDPEAIKKYDAEVEQYNADLERIKAENDANAVRIFVERLLDISRNG